MISVAAQKPLPQRARRKLGCEVFTVEASRQDAVMLCTEKRGRLTNLRESNDLGTQKTTAERTVLGQGPVLAGQWKTLSHREFGRVLCGVGGAGTGVWRGECARVLKP